MLYWIVPYSNNTVLREHKPPLTLQVQPTVIRDSNPDCIQIRIRMSAGSLPKCCGFIRLYLVGVSHFAKFRKNQALTVWELPINLKSPILQWYGKWQSVPEYVSRTGTPPEVNQLIRPSYNIKSEWNPLITFTAILHTDRMTDKLTWSHNLHLGSGKDRRFGKDRHFEQAELTVRRWHSRSDYCEAFNCSTKHIHKFSQQRPNHVNMLLNYSMCFIIAHREGEGWPSG